MRGGEARRREDIHPSSCLREHRTRLRAEDTGKHKLVCRAVCVFVCHAAVG